MIKLFLIILFVSCGTQEQSLNTDTCNLQICESNTKDTKTIKRTSSKTIKQNDSKKSTQVTTPPTVTEAGNAIVTSTTEENINLIASENLNNQEVQPLIESNIIVEEVSHTPEIEITETVLETETELVIIEESLNQSEFLTAIETVETNTISNNETLETENTETIEENEIEEDKKLKSKKVKKLKKK